jgi:hypothetical protein
VEDSVEHKIETIAKEVYGVYVFSCYACSV